MNLVAYADESGTHDPTGKRIGADAVTISGLVAPKESWISFDIRWRAILNKYHGVKYFHAREHHSAWLVATGRTTPNSDFKKNPYNRWSVDELNDFAMELAPLAGSNLIIGGWVPTKLYHEDKHAGLPNKDRDPYELCLDHFFDSAVSTIKQQRAPWRRQPISFLFDWSEDNDWRHTVDLRFEFHKNKFKKPPFVEIGFRKKTEHTPLQAADMVAYRLRHNMSKLSNLDFSKSWPELDDILFKEMNESIEKLAQAEKDAMLRRCFIIPKNTSYEQAMDAISSAATYGNKNKK